MKRRKQSYIFSIITAVLVIAVITITSLYIMNIQKQKENVAAFATMKESTENDAEYLKAQIASLESEKTELSNKLAAVIKEKEELINSFSDKDSLYYDLNVKFESLNAEIALRDSAIAQLQYNIEKLENDYMIDINSQYNILNELTELLANPIMIEIKNTIKNADGTETEVITYETPKIALYYEDINNGYKYAYNPDEVFDPASMIKAPFILSLLIEASAEEERIAAKETGTPERRFDMTKKITYTKDAYYQSGSGEIINSKDGTEYTYRDLFYHVLECSDNVAYTILKNTFGTEYYGSLVVKLGATSMYKKPVGMSAADAGKCMKAVYEFTESDAYYAAFMKDALIGSAHLTMIPYSVSPKKAAHKYGWDVGAYNDMAIVYSENPYVLSVLTNYDSGGKEVDGYIQSLLKLIDKMHDNFYIKR